MKPLEYIGVPTASREELAACKLEDIGKALLLALYCGRAVNGGRIEAAAAWSARDWLVRIGIDGAPEGAVPGLWHWEGDTLCVDLYNTQNEDKVKARRERAKAAINTRWNRACSTEGNTEGNTTCISGCITDSTTACNTKIDGITTPYSRSDTFNHNHNNNIYNNNIYNACADTCARTHEEHTAQMVENSLQPEQPAMRNADVPQSAEEVLSYFRAMPTCGLPQSEREDMARKFYAHYEAYGWIGSGGRAIRNWKQLAQLWVSKSQLGQYQPKSAGGIRQGVNNKNDYTI